MDRDKKEIDSSLINWFNLLRKKWNEVPLGVTERIDTLKLIKMDNNTLISIWKSAYEECQKAFDVRGWYYELYKDILKGKKILDVGSGLGFDAFTFAQHGADVTCVDIVEENILVLKRLASLLHIRKIKFFILTELNDINSLPYEYDIIWCQGSLLNMPFQIARQESLKLLEHLKNGGRWIELAYPKSRWIKEDMMPFDKWGEKTDGGAPWIEWYDINKLLKRLEPHKFKVILNFEFHKGDFIWFDLLKIE
ncbi:hypothetical protein JCM12298_03910 [Desulfothermus naphthae]